MCKCCQECFESCYWHFIEERFCFDKNIALYEEPVKKSSEKNNNLFDNMAFYDSVSVIAGRSIVTIDPMPVKKNEAVIEQPRKRPLWPSHNSKDLEPDYLKPSRLPAEDRGSDPNSTDTGNDTDTQRTLIVKKERKKLDEKFPIKKSVSFHNIPDKSSSDESDEKTKSSGENLSIPEEDVGGQRKKSLRERRMSKSLYLKIDFPKEVPIIRQNSVPKFFMDSPEENQIRDSSLTKTPTTILKSPLTASLDFDFDLYSVVQIEKSRIAENANKAPPVPIHKESSKLSLIKDKMKLKKSKSTLSASNLPYTSHM
ncbi:uncharacterized protein LOC132698979 isoform X2 [Cylas formicarius]|uniref:uncharacterized protein LOC132698979 isoform X2 n=1 Tax=Cylas formicarius TaxID=197179 RepID=UPI0029589E41|nr:uncharacterized protein LOC132698979 isoform X2 [Cylas formicarius]XP_060521339.1 uncharacterized protein LOC132698979 isoform X2 [Cylas formicarius]